MPMPLPSQVHRCHLLPAPPHSPSLVTLLSSPFLNLFTPPPATTTTLYSGDIMFINTASFVAGAVVASPEQPAKLVRDQRRVVPGSCRARRGAASNGFRTYCMQTWSPFTNRRYEAMSYLPPLSAESISKEIEFIMSKGWVPCLEFDKEGEIHRSNSRMPGYYDGRYWTLWKLPMFGCSDAAAVLREVEECRREYPDAFIRLIAFDSSRQCQCMSFVVHKPPSAAASPATVAGAE
uniref:Ribulose bisphosphate carboxylase small subunit, chloroplastic n=1 Tax=Oryza meridionalis TaxID=40149 RepID=A0A0E0CFR8_9ORYZ